MTGLAFARGDEAARPRAVDAPRPASFAERGLAIAFTTPALAASRLRLDSRGRFEIVMPNLVDGRGVYIAPWPALSEVMAVTVHDRMLHAELAAEPSLDPERARLAQLRVAARGFAGADAAEIAVRALGADERVATAANLALMVQLIHDGGVTSAGALEAAESGRAVLEFKRALSSIAARVGMAALELADRIATLSASLAPLGLPDPQPAGRLRRLVRQVAALRAELAEWADSEGGEHAEIARLCSDMAADTAERCRAVLESADRRLANLVASLRAGPRECRFLDEVRLQLAWRLDGWKRAVITWQAVRDAPRPDQEAALDSLFRGLPILPSEADPQESGLDLALAYRRSMRRQSRRLEIPDDATAGRAVRRMELTNAHAELL